MKGDNLSNQIIKVYNGYSSLTLPRSIWLHLVGTLVQITVPKGDVTFRLVASGYRDKPDKIS